MTRLYLIRHGIAEEKARSDAFRMLTDKGRRRFRKTARSFGQRVDLILTSPLVRAVQTAEILAGETKHGEMRVLEELSPGESAASALSAVAKAAGKARSVALVGHDPQLTQILAELAHVEATKLDFKKGAIVRVDVSGLPQAKGAQARSWWKPRSGAKKKGLPLKDRPKAAALRAKAAPADPARKSKARKAAKARKPRQVETGTEAEAPVEAPPAAEPRQRQTFMGSPRQSTPEPDTTEHDGLEPETEPQSDPATVPAQEET